MKRKKQVATRKVRKQKRKMTAVVPVRISHDEVLRVHTGGIMSYRVVYGETIPVWERIFPSLREAEAFAKEHESFGDVIFDISRVVPGERPRSVAAAIEAGTIPGGRKS